MIHEIFLLLLVREGDATKYEYVISRRIQDVGLKEHLSTVML